MGQFKSVIFVAGAAVLAAGMAVVNYFSLNDLSHTTIQLFLRQYGSSIYEYRATTGEWPTCIDDLGRTSLPKQMRDWKVLLQDEVIVIVWWKDLQPDPPDNAQRILAYHNKGLYARLGRVWVCWGDLRTEYVPLEVLRAHLRAG